jgi:hypothetical protein
MCRDKVVGGLGFQDLENFNLALLAKQGWWLMTITHSLVFRVLKSKYFPSGTFLDAKLGSNPFFLWRSILAGRPTLMAGLFWRVGNGRSIRVVEDAWLPMPAVVKEGVN